MEVIRVSEANVEIDRVVINPDFPDPICMGCGRECGTWEVLRPQDVSGNKHEMWCYCNECGIDTFHKIPDEAL